VYIGRMMARTDVGRGRLQGSVIIERAVSSLVERDAADFITTLGWSRRIGKRTSLGVESIGQDLEGLWNRAEAEGGAKLLVGPSFQARSPAGDWAASLTAGPVVHPQSSGHHFGIFASASWVPSLRR